VITLTETAPGDGNSISVTSTVTDVAGNASTSSTATAKEDISAPAAPTVAITTDANSNGFITNAELSGSSTVHATVALNAAGQTDLTNGGTVQITVVDAGVTQNLVLHMSGSNLIDGSGNTYAYSGGVITLTETSPGDTKTITVTSTETDAAGNVSAAGSATATEDLVVPVAPTASITTDSNQDGYISVAELNGSSTVNATVTLAAAAQTDITNGGSVQVTVNDGGVVQNLSLHLSGANLVDGSGNTYGYTGGVITLTETAPASGSSISVSATVIDKAGNVSVASNTATAQVDIVDAPAVAIAFPPSISTGLTQSQWINNATINGALYTTAGNNGNGTNPGTLINTLNNTAISPTTSVVTAVSNASVTAGTATETSGLIYLQAGHTYAFSGAIDDSFGLQVGGKLVGTDTWGINSGAFSGSFTASANGWYTIATYHDNQSGPGNYNLNVSDNGATAVALNATNFTLAPSLTALASAGIALNAEVVTTTTTNITTTGSNSSGAATVGTTVTGGYYTTEPVASITLDSNDQAILTAGGTMHVTGSDGTNMTLHWNGSALVDGSGTSHTYSGGIVSLPLAANLNTPVVTVSATVTDTHGISSLTTTTSEIYSGTNSLTEVAGGDTFRFELAANGTAGTPHIETISGFNSNVSSNGGDVLNLADLLQGATSSNITNYLHFTTATSAGVTTTTVHVSETGGYSAGFSSTLDTLQIALTNVDLVHSGGSTLTDAAIIQSLLTKGKLVE
ncbi:MAG TPA: type I secretion C-terminal target domain-containing protein, partial [Burkholderiaceae bacterium]